MCSVLHFDWVCDFFFFFLLTHSFHLQQSHLAFYTSAGCRLHHMPPSSRVFLLVFPALLPICAVQVTAWLLLQPVWLCVSLITVIWSAWSCSATAGSVHSGLSSGHFVNSPSKFQSLSPSSSFLLLSLLTLWKRQRNINLSTSLCKSRTYTHYHWSTSLYKLCFNKWFHVITSTQQ